MVSSSISCIGQHQCWKCLFAIPWIFFSWLICLWFLNFKLLLIHYLGVSGVINVPPGLFPLHPAGLMFLLDNLIHITVLAIYSFPQQMSITNYCALHTQDRRVYPLISTWMPYIPKTWSVWNLTFHLSLKTCFSCCLLSWSKVPPTNQTKIILDFLSLPHSLHPTGLQFLWIPCLDGSPIPCLSIHSYCVHIQGLECLL